VGESARERLLEFVRGFADGVQVLDVPDIHPCGGLFVRDRLNEMFEAGSRGDAREVSRLADEVDERIAQERAWNEESHRTALGLPPVKPRRRRRTVKGATRG
jgi:hypothetical protein